MRKIKFLLFFIFVIVNAFAAELSLTVDKKSISEADTLYLTITYTGDSDNAPDFSELEKDFHVVSNSTSKQFNFINGKATQLKQWTIGLQPLRLGKINIAPVRLDKLISNSAEIEVTEVSDVAFAPDYKENANSPFFKIEQQVNASSFYVQQQALLFVHIYDSVGLQDGLPTIYEESKSNWIIIPLTNHPIIKQDVINQRHVNVATYVFAIFAQKSGEIELPQVSFDGYYIKNARFNAPSFGDDLMALGIDFNHVFGQRIPVRMKTKKEKVNVLPIPAGYSVKEWLPLSDLQLSATWSARNGFKVGEAVTRTINIKAVGMNESMLPAIDFVDTPDIKQYPEKPVASEEVINGQVVTSAQINNVYIPTKSGDLVVPAISIRWFDVQNNKQQIATIPEEKIFVLPNPDIESSQDKEDAKTVETNVFQQQNNNTLEDVTEKTFNKPSKQDNKSHVYLFAILFSLLIVFIVGLFFLKRKKMDKSSKSVISAMKRHDYQKAKDDLLLWAKKKYYPADNNNFNDIMHLVNDDAFSEQLSALNRFLYSNNAEFFDSNKFITIFKRVNKMRKKESKNNDVLPNLYD